MLSVRERPPNAAPVRGPAQLPAVGRGAAHESGQAADEDRPRARPPEVNGGSTG
ncbi:hypothetical protein [Nocardia asiatica]|uniref:hypothetical protein n=1 Tax=Nocardia asiatica TaxID=209252 RepID=UPI003EE404D4